MTPIICRVKGGQENAMIWKKKKYIYIYMYDVRLKEYQSNMAEVR